MANNLAHYKVYVIRYWEEQGASTDAIICRFTLEVPGTGQRFGFTSSKALMDEIERRLAEDATETTDEPFSKPFDEE
jgi:hypothetical protein